MAEADWAELEVRLRAVATEGDAAWPALQASLHGELVRLARFQPIGRLRSDVDAAADVAVRVLARLHANDYAVVKRLIATTPLPPLRAWVRVLVRTAAIDLMRAHAEYVRGNGRETGGWISLATLASQPGAAAPDSLVEKQRELERFLGATLEAVERAVAEHGDDAVGVLSSAWRVAPTQVRRLVRGGARYLPVLRLVLAGHSYPEIAKVLSTTRRDVELIVGYIEELLRARRFGQVG